MLVRKANVVKEETKLAARLYNLRNQSIYLSDGVTVMSLSARLLQRVCMAMDCLMLDCIKPKITA